VHGQHLVNERLPGVIRRPHRLHIGECFGRGAVTLDDAVKILKEKYPELKFGGFFDIDIKQLLNK